MLDEIKNNAKTHAKKIKKNIYKKGLVVAAASTLAIVGVAGCNQNYQKCQQVNKITALMNSDTDEGKNLAKSMIDNGLAEEKLTIIEPNGYLLFDKKIAEYHTIDTSLKPVKEVVDAAEAFDYEVKKEYVMLDIPVEK